MFAVDLLFLCAIACASQANVGTKRAKVVRNFWSSHRLTSRVTMTQIFHPSMNAVARGTIFGAVFIIAGLGWAGSVWVRSSYVTKADVVRDQPVPFSHDHHVGGLGIDCRYCHTTVETSAFAGMPATEVCMGCHSQIWKDSALLAPVRESYRNGTPLAWTRVHDMADFVYFNHSIHVAKGIACESCHGRVDRMPLMRKAVAMHMEWCLNCHRHPETAVRDRQDVFKFGMESQRGAGVMKEEAHAEHVEESPDTSRQSDRTIRQGKELVQEYGIVTSQLTNCTICHR